MIRSTIKLIRCYRSIRLSKNSLVQKTSYDKYNECCMSIDNNQYCIVIKMGFDRRSEEKKGKNN